MSTEDGGDTLDWEGDVIDSVFASNSGDDLNEGNGRANMLAGFGGTDTLRGGSGDDYLRVDDRAGGTSWRASDTVYRNPPNPDTGFPGDTVADDCENQEGPIVYRPTGVASNLSSP